MNTGSTIRQAAVAGLFYAGSREQLHADVDALLRDAPKSPSAGALIGLIVPHAGYLYSGATAAAAYALLKGRAIDAVILVGPSHQEYFHGVSVYPGSAYATPLGTVAIDTELRDAVLASTAVVHASMQGHREEHSLEVQLPFLQSVLPDAKILPLVMGDQRAENCFDLGDALASSMRGRNVLLVASSDLSHFHSSPAARVKDRKVIGLIEQYDIGALTEQLGTGSAEACGGGPIVAVMTAAQELGADCATIVHACNSGDVTGETGRVVGYCSAALWKKS